MSLLILEQILDIINIACLSCNILFISYIRYFAYKFYRKTHIKVLATGTRRILDGFLIIELLNLMALYSWVSNDVSAEIGGLTNWTTILYVFAEHIRSFYFLSVILITGKDVKFDAAHILDAIGDKINGCKC